MARLARVIIPGLPHHITQRGNGRQKVFFSDEDYATYKSLLLENCRLAGVSCWAWCLMPNQIHLILVPSDEDGLRAALSATHRRYAGLINARRKKTGHFWQGRYGCAVMDEDHLTATFRYILRNPVTTRLAKEPEKWPWSSARTYLKGSADGLTTTAPMLNRFPTMRKLLGHAFDGEEYGVPGDETIGRPRGSDTFLKAIEKRTGRSLRPMKRGPKPSAGKDKTKRKTVSARVRKK